MDNIIDEKLFEFIYSQVLLLNGVTIPGADASQDEKNKYEQLKNLLTYYINEICNNILIKTNRNTFPEGLKYLAVELTNNAYEMYNSNNTDNNQTIQSMSETGRTVNFGVSDTWKTKYQILINRQLNDNEKLINRYRLLYKTRCPYEKN